MHSLSTTRSFTAMLAGAMLVCGFAPEYSGAADDVPVGPPPIAITPSDGFNLVVKEQIDGHHVVVAVSPAVHNFFAGTFTNLPTDVPLTIGLNMNGIECIGNKADVKKWIGLVPVMTYADPTKYESYECYERTGEGVWLCTDPLRPKDKRYAGMEETPEQTVIPKDLAKEFLSKDEKRWEPWREVDGAQAFPDTNVFRITHQFRAATATVAMRVPYTYTYQQQYLDRLAAAKLPGVTVLSHFRRSPGKHLLRLIKISPLDPEAEKAPHAILAYAREHATEPDGSWAVAGMAQWLVSDDPKARAARERCTWLLVPMLDIDGACNAVMADGDFFYSMRSPAKNEAAGLGLLMTDWLDGGRHIDIVVNLHNVECAEAPNLSCPFVNAKQKEHALAVNALLYNQLAATGVLTEQAKLPSHVGSENLRCAGWCSRCFGSLELAYEVNTRCPRSRLGLASTLALGAPMADVLGAYLQGKEFAPTDQAIAALLAKRAIDRPAYYKRVKRNTAQRSLYDLFFMGY